MKNQYAIVVDSCEKYSDCWKPMSQCLEKFWLNGTNDKINVYLITDDLGHEDYADLHDNTIFN